jgi:hypothetical protein
VVTAVIVLSCTRRNPNEYSIEIKRNNNNDFVSLCQVYPDSLVELAIEINADNYSFKEVVKHSKYLIIKTKTENIPVIVNPGDKINVILNNSIDNHVITGSEESQKFLLLKKKGRNYIATLNSLHKQFLDNMMAENVDSIRASLKSIADSVINSHKNEVERYIYENSDKLSALLALGERYDNNRFVLDNDSDIKLFFLVDSMLKNQYSDYGFFNHFHDEVNRLKKDIIYSKSNADSVNIGSRPPVIILPDTAGVKRYLPLYGGRYIYLSFLSTDNKNFERELDMLKKIAGRKDAKKILLYTVWLEKNEDEFKNIINKYLPVGVNVCDTLSSESVYIKKYGIEALPTGFIINRYGKLIESHIRAKELLSKIETLK